MNTQLLKSALTAISLLAIPLATTNAATIILDDDNLLGTVEPSSPNDTDNAIAQVTFLINAYNAGGADGDDLGDNPADPQAETYTLYLPDGAVAPLPGVVSGTAVVTTDPLIDLGGIAYDYVLYKQGNDAWIYYIGWVDADDSIDWGGSSVLAPKGGGDEISHYVLFNGGGTNVPDAGATIGLLGLGLLVTSLIARRRKLV